MKIPLPTVVLTGQSRTVSGSLAGTVARFARGRAVELESTDDAERLNRLVAETCGALIDAVRSAKALDNVNAMLLDIRRAVDGDADCTFTHDAVRLALDLRINREAMRRVCPEIETRNLDDFRTELRDAIARVTQARDEAWAAVHQASRVAAWTLRHAIRQCADVGAALRVAVRAGMLPELDPRLAFAAVPDGAAPLGSAERNSADALSSLVLPDALAQRDRTVDEERVGRELVARISQIIAEEISP